jgi:hypothetical protein
MMSHLTSEPGELYFSLPRYSGGGSGWGHGGMMNHEWRMQNEKEARLNSLFIIHHSPFPSNPLPSPPPEYRERKKWGRA